MQPFSANRDPLRQSMVRWIKLAFVMWLGLKIGGCTLMLPSPWGPRVGGRLPNEHEVYFRSRKIGQETDDQLIWISPHGHTKHFWVDQIHAGFDYVTIRYSSGGEHVWVESDGRIGASLDVTTSDFRAELAPQHSWATLGDGTELDSGSTGSVLWLLGPW